MEKIYEPITGYTNDSNNQSYKGGFTIGDGDENHEQNTVSGGVGKTRFQNKVIPFGLAMKRVKPMIGYECKKGDVLDSSLFEQLFNMVAKVEKREKKMNNLKNKTKRVKNNSV
jgi:hypothetical protein